MTTLRESIEALADESYAHPCSGYRNEVYLDPEERRVYVFSAVGSGWPMRAHNGIDRHVLTIPQDAVAESVRDAMDAHADLLAAICDAFEGTEWNGSNHVGQWSEGSEELLGELGLREWPEIACWWEPGDWYSQSSDEEITDDAIRMLTADEPEDVAEELATRGASNDCHVDPDALLEYLRAWAVEHMTAIPIGVLTDEAWIVPRECDGQIVEVAYALDPERGLLRRTVDRSQSPRQPRYHVAEWDAVEGPAEPWNDEPEARDWTPVLPVRA